MIMRCLFTSVNAKSCHWLDLFHLFDSHIRLASSSITDLGAIFDSKLSFEFKDPYTVKALLAFTFTACCDWHPFYTVKIERIQEKFVKYAFRRLSWDGKPVLICCLIAVVTRWSIWTHCKRNVRSGSGHIGSYPTRWRDWLSSHELWRNWDFLRIRLKENFQVFLIRNKR
jgi:hypothetical protein